MAKRISELPAAGTVSGTDELELNQSGTSRKATRAQIIAGLAAATHVHTLADVTDAGALAAKDVVDDADIADDAVTTAKLADLSVTSSKLAEGAVTTAKLAANAVTAAEIAADAVGTDQLQDFAVATAKIADGAVTGGKIAADAVGTGQLADDAVTAAKIAGGAVTAAEIAANAVGPDQLASSAVTEMKIANAAVTMAKIATAAVDSGQLADNAVVSAKIASNAVTPGKIAANAVGSSELADGAVTESRIASGAVSMAKIDAKAVGPGQLADTAVTPGVYTVATVEVDQQGRITAASSGTAGEANTGTNVGTDGVGMFAGKLGADLQFRHIAPGSSKVSVTLNGEDIDVDVIDGNLQIPAGNVTGLAAVATVGTLAALTSLDADGGALTNHLAAQDTLTDAYTFVQSDSGREKVFTGAAPAMWTIPALSAGTHAVVHNIGTGAISFAASGVSLKGLTTLAADKTAAASWLPGNVVKLTGELS